LNRFQESKAKLVIGTVYILLGMAILAMCFNLMQEKIVVQVENLVQVVWLKRLIVGGHGHPGDVLQPDAGDRYH
jgi:hypothetical protein